MPAGLCLVAGGAMRAFLPTLAFTLAWTHSIEKTRWTEDWQVTPAGLALVEARIEGSGAGMEPPDGAILRDGVWHYTPAIPPVQSVALSVSPWTRPWELCIDGDCQSIRTLARIEEPVAAVQLTRCERPRGGS